MIMIETRDKILDAVFTDVRRNGFQGLRADKVIQHLGITKGALYHYFDTKYSLGYAVVDELLEPLYTRPFNELLTEDGDPIAQLIHLLDIHQSMINTETVRLGCPLNNLIQEMSPIDEGFRTRLQRVLEHMHTRLVAALERGKQAGQVRSGIPSEAQAYLFLSSLEGAYSMAKVNKSEALFIAIIDQLKELVKSWRP